tara:strand:+ start:89 stop:322 length:234 start_codon:yes stop_codon:yes gene_type:complete
MQLQNQPVNINPDDLEDIKCKKVLESLDKCGSKNFTQVYQMKKLSALLSPNGQEQIVTLPVFICNDCGEELSELKPE